METKVATVETLEETGTETLLTGWGRATPSRSRVVRPGSLAALEALVGSLPATGRVLGRGLGRAYGDAAQLAGGTVVDCTGLDRVVSIDPVTGVARVEAGCSIEALVKAALAKGFFVPVSPGTRHVTLGGAIAADVHGKNHHVDGSLGRHVTSITLVGPEGRREISRSTDPDALEATTGGMGLTGIVAEAVLRLVPVETSMMVVDTEKVPDLEECMARLERDDGHYRYSVAWVDCLSSGKRLGRGVLTRGDHARRDQLPGVAGAELFRYEPGHVVDVGRLSVKGLLNPVAAAAFNEVWYRRAPRRRLEELQGITAFFHPLDGVGRWNRLYGPRGFTQYQFVVPLGEEHVVKSVIEGLGRGGVPCYLGVLKRFGEAGSGHLSFPSPGWTLALDLPLGAPGLARMLDAFDDLVASAGGRVYLAKDGRLRPELLPVMYPRLEDWRAVRSRLDPGGTFGSDLGARLGLCR